MPYFADDFDINISFLPQIKLEFILLIFLFILALFYLPDPQESVGGVIQRKAITLIAFGDDKILLSG